jgi:hypothetical protein
MGGTQTPCGILVGFGSAEFEGLIKVGIETVRKVFGTKDG